MRAELLLVTDTAVALAHQQLIHHLKTYGSPGLVAWAFKNRRSLAALIDDVWSWETVGDTLTRMSQTRAERLLGAAQEACSCRGRWRELAEQCCVLNNIHCKTILVSYLMPCLIRFKVRSI